MDAGRDREDPQADPQASIADARKRTFVHQSVDAAVRTHTRSLTGALTLPETGRSSNARPKKHPARAPTRLACDHPDLCLLAQRRVFRREALQRPLGLPYHDKDLLTLAHLKSTRCFADLVY